MVLFYFTLYKGMHSIRPRQAVSYTYIKYWCQCSYICKKKPYSTDLVNFSTYTEGLIEALNSWRRMRHGYCCFPFFKWINPLTVIKLPSAQANLCLKGHKTVAQLRVLLKAMHWNWVVRKRNVEWGPRGHAHFPLVRESLHWQ